MKKLRLEMLRLTSDEVLGRNQMKKITGGAGGGSWVCYCGHVGGPGQGDQFLVAANDTSEALEVAQVVCVQPDVTCNGA
ncbi:hypothetical protein [Fontibacter flavus]|uniref:Natural product n=1 Tax=Fontibacter flavus TaxID=654838 RepID=A0ABV6FPW5_9BACT